MPPSTGELYTPRRERDGPNSALSGFAESFDSFAESFGNFAVKSGILTKRRCAQEQLNRGGRPRLFYLKTLKKKKQRV